MASKQDPLDKLSEGRQLMRERDYEGAVACFDEAMALNPTR